jgi:hypothetical protein
MADADDVRRLALALPQVEEIDSDGFDFRVGGKGFVWSYPERRPGQRRVIRTDIAVLYVGDEAEKQALLLGEPGVFFTAPGYDGWPLVMLRLAEVDAGRLAELVTDAWRMRAPYELAADLDLGLQEEGQTALLPGSGESAAESASGDQLGRDHVALDLVGALADDHQRRVPEVALDVVLGRVAVAAVDPDRVERDLHRGLRGE